MTRPETQTLFTNCAVFVYFHEGRWHLTDRFYVAEQHNARQVYPFDCKPRIVVLDIHTGHVSGILQTQLMPEMLEGVEA